VSAGVSSSFPFRWARKRDGRLVPFEADKISRALFAATENLGRPDAFLARELADGVLHFLAAEKPGAVVTTEQVSDCVTKVVRELGQPALARAFEEGGRSGRAAGLATDHEQPQAVEGRPALERVQARPSPGHPGKSIEEPSPSHELGQGPARLDLQGFSLREIFTRDLAAAHADRLLILGGLETPLKLTAGLLAPPSLSAGDLLKAIDQARSLVGGFVVLDGPEYLLARQSLSEEAATDFMQVLQTALRLSHLTGVVNLNCRIRPPGSEDRAPGPLFAGEPEPPGDDVLNRLREATLETLSGKEPNKAPLRIDWHLAAADFLPAAQSRLQRLARCALKGVPVTFVFDRPRRPVALAEGVDRPHPNLLLEVGVNLPRLLDQLRPGLDPAEFVHKVGSLARLALSAGTQKRDFLRRQSVNRPGLQSAFLLERARLKVVPVGLDEAVRRLLGNFPEVDDAALEFARQIIARLHNVLGDDGQGRLLDTCVGSAYPDSGFPEDRAFKGGPEPALEHRLRAAGVLHAVTGQGTALLLFPERENGSSARVIQLLRYAWQRTDVVRVCWLLPGAPSRQLLAPGEPG